MQIEFSRSDCEDLDTNLGREWLVTNGLGGYASGTLAGVNTRRYHGLLIAANRPPIDRIALLVRLNETLTIDGETFEFMTAEYEDGTMNSSGARQIESFALEQGIPVWSYTAGNHLIRRMVWMVPGHNITVVRYRLANGRGPADLAVRPLCAARDHHSVQHGNHDWHFAMDEVNDGVKVQATPDSPPLWLLAKGAYFSASGDWYWRFLLREERRRGYDYVEDLYQAGTFRISLDPGQSLTLVASAEDPSDGLPSPEIALASIRTRQAFLGAPRNSESGGYPPWLPELRHALRSAGDQFIVSRAVGESGDRPLTTAIAAYHWYSDWARDAMISLPGLLIGTGRRDVAASLLTRYAEYIDKGMIPNRIPDPGDRPEYSTADATLWFFRALRATLEADSSSNLLQELYPRLKDVIAWHERGTRFGIGVDEEDGLLRAGETLPDGTQTRLTWMDARYKGDVITPRVGKPVEINALWIDALDCMAEWAPCCGDDPTPFTAAASRAAASFAEKFWYEAGGYLYDVVDGPEGNDTSLRPNQLIALGLRRQIMPLKRGRRALARVADELITVYGLRTLSANDPRYRKTCFGDEPTRERAYHQGTVWPWLLGPYVDACRRYDVEGVNLPEILAPFFTHLREAGIGCISGVFDGDPPHTPRGCIEQAWSVAELQRILTMARAEDLKD